MKFGINLYPYYNFPDVKSLSAFCQKAESLGYEAVEFPEHPAYPSSMAHAMGALWYDSVVLASYVAAVTTRIRLVFGIIILSQHKPLWLAKQLATLDMASGGRVTLGVGVGWLEPEFRLLGVDFRKRGAITDEYIAAIRALWGADPCTYEGEHISFRDLVSVPKPVQKPFPPIYVGGGIKSSVKRAATLGDGWMPMSGPAEEFEAALKWLKEEMRRTGRSMEGFAVFRGIPLFGHSAEAEEHVKAAGVKIPRNLGGDFDKALDYVRHHTALGVTHMGLSFPHMPLVRAHREMEVFSRKVIARA